MALLLRHIATSHGFWQRWRVLTFPSSGILRHCYASPSLLRWCRCRSVQVSGIEAQSKQANSYKLEHDSQHTRNLLELSHKLQRSIKCLDKSHVQLYCVKSGRSGMVTQRLIVGPRLRLGGNFPRSGLSRRGHEVAFSAMEMLIRGENPNRRTKSRLF
ncbi:hypothetical protein BD769DRAFT_575321 [Suillus cothurnatus]|nr:hypothetical protein BD769DRAFT_575321 [Suillus cothurnatus]